MRFANNDIFSNPGSPIHQLYAPVVDDKGNLTLEPSGIENTDDYIQSFAESTDMQVILSRIQAGEVELLNKRPGSYGDFTQLPQTYAEALQLQIESNRLYDSLPLDVKAKFNNDSNQFFAQAGSTEWFKKIEAVLPAEVKEHLRPVDTIQPVNPPVDRKEVSE